MKIDRMAPEQWRRLRDTRLRLLKADPDSFGSTLEIEQPYSDEEWAERAKNPKVATFFASENGQDCGISVGAPYRHNGRDCAGLYSMWIDPAMRGRGLGGKLVDAVIEWAKDAGYQELCLEVGDHNTAAIALYESRGFVPTGNTFKMEPPRDHITEHERLLVLRESRLRENHMQEFLRSTEVIDWDTPEIRALASSLAVEADQLKSVASCFTWVRDEVTHSFDVSAQCVTCTASETLGQRTGICYAKSHLLAALLRALGIPTGFGYQRVALDESATAFCLHGFNFVHLPKIGWFPVDPRGNRGGITTTFNPPEVSLAFEPRLPGEKTFDDIYPDPIGCVVDSLQSSDSVSALRSSLPDQRSSRGA